MVRQLININTAPLRLDINVKLGSYDMTSPRASWDVNVTKSEMTVKKDPVKLKIDRRDMYASMGIYMPSDFAEKTVRENKQLVLDTIAEIGEDWRSVGETQGASLVDICLKNSGWNTVELHQTWIPGVKPNITWSGGTPSKVDFTQFKLDIKWQTHERPNVRYEKGANQVSVSQWNKVNIEYTGTVSDVIKLGSESARKLNIKV